ncbi:replicative helicase loader/inhibitor [Paenibacillus sp. FSL P2-0173]|uniref:replicative helicase loader/inhibitor n=1 Tax=Paenibacillus sp. FSL P2-0173 TaxID=2921627 RepID=UPI0030F8E6D0
MKQTETASFLAVIKTAYPYFEITVPVTKLWHQMLADIPYEVAKERLGKHIRTSKFAPTISDICTEEDTQPSFYELQRAEEQAEALALEEYNQQAVPMPDHIRERLERLNARMRLNHES